MNEIEFEDAYAIKATAGGVKCGNHHPEDRTYHANVASVRACYQLTIQMDLDNAAEIWAEGALVRHLENQGWQDTLLEEQMAGQRGIW
jgi:hypothetical protein